MESNRLAALRTISLRLRGTSTKELEEAGEDTEGVVTSKSKLRSKIKGYTGIDILTDSGAYKSTYEILLEISKVWDDLTDKDRAGLLEMLAGKTRSNTAAAILSNTKDLEAAYKSAMEAEGSALAENEKYLDSIQGRIDLFNNSIQTMWNTELDSGIIKFVINLGTGLVKVVDKLELINTLVFGLMSYWTIFKKDKTDLASIFGLHDVEKGWFYKRKQITNDDAEVPDGIEVSAQEYADAINDNIQDYVNIDTAQSVNSKYLGIFENGLGQGATEKLTYNTQQLGVELDKLNNMDNAGIVNYMSNLDSLGDVGEDTRLTLAAYASTVKDGNYTLQGASEYVKNYNQNLSKLSKETARAQLTQGMLNFAISAFAALLSALITKLINLAASAQNKFEKLSTQLSSTKTELENINSELDETKKRIEELQNQGS